MQKRTGDSGPGAGRKIRETQRAREAAGTNGTGIGERAEVVKTLLKKVEAKLAKGVEKASLADYIRLVQLHKELDEETPREIKVSWVEPGERETEEGGS